VAAMVEEDEKSMRLSDYTSCGWVKVKPPIIKKKHVFIIKHFPIFS
jgi:hypothetical protein